MSLLDLLVNSDKEIKYTNKLFVESSCQFQDVIQISDMNPLSLNVGFKHLDTPLIKAAACILFFEHHPELVTLIDLFF